MPGWTAIPIALIALLLIALPVAALTDTGLERDVRRELGLETGVCEPMTDESSAWVTGPSLPYDLDEPRGVTIDGDVYLVGGITGLEEAANGELLLEPSDQLTRFDPRTGRYESLAPLPRPLNHMGLVAYEGDLYAIGGYGRRLDVGTSDGFYRYSPDEDKWSRMPDLPEPRGAMAVGVVGDRLIMAGGALGLTAKPDAFSFDFRTRRWSRLPEMPSRREHVGQAVVGDKLFVLGGRSEEVLASDVAEVYDVGEQRWERLPKMPQETGGLIAVAVDGNVVAVGGGNDMAGTVTGAVQRWDLQKRRWTLLSGMRTPRHGHAATAADGKIWVFGGSPCAYFNSTDSVEWLALR
jgi:N-acetylneuraminic acid mutarotase